MNRIGIIGGSGLDDPRLLGDEKVVEADTPWGKPASPLTLGEIGGRPVVLLSRHGKEHTHTPTGVNYRANIHALREQGCTRIIATTACGSLREEIGKGDFVILDQFIDFTRHRPVTYYEEFAPGQARHVSLADPFDGELREKLIRAASELGIPFHPRGTVVTIEGPRFSTRAESNMFRLWGADVINMTVAPEAILAREAGIPYAAVAMSTDYDCWKTDEPPVTFEEILETFAQNVEKVKQLLLMTIPAV